MKRRASAQFLAVFGGLAALASIIYAARDAGLESWPFLIGVMVWSALPYMALFVLAGRAAGHRVWSRVLVAAIVLVTAAGAWLFLDGFFIHPDPQSGLLFVFLPFYQLAVVAVIFVVGALTKAWTRPSGRTSE